MPNSKKILLYQLVKKWYAYSIIPVGVALLFVGDYVEYINPFIFQVSDSVDVQTYLQIGLVLVYLVVLLVLCYLPVGESEHVYVLSRVIVGAVFLSALHEFV